MKRAVSILFIIFFLIVSPMSVLADDEGFIVPLPPIEEPLEPNEPPIGIPVDPIIPPEISQPIEPPVEQPIVKQTAALSLHMKFNGGAGSYDLSASIPMSEEEFDTITGIEVYYSYDGIQYNQLVDEYGETDFIDYCTMRRGSFHAIILRSMQSPFKEFTQGEYPVLYFKLNIIGSIYEGETTVAKLEKNTEVVELPEQYKVTTMYPKGIADVKFDEEEGLIIYGLYKDTVIEGYKDQDVLSRLPNSIPMNVQILDETQFVASKTVMFDVNWAIPENIDRWDAGTYIIEGNATSKQSETDVIHVGIDTYQFRIPENTAPLLLELTIDDIGPPSTLPPPPIIEEDGDVDEGSGGNRGNAGSNSDQKEAEEAELKEQEEIALNNASQLPQTLPVLNVNHLGTLESEEPRSNEQIESIEKQQETLSSSDLQMKKNEQTKIELNQMIVEEGINLPKEGSPKKSENHPQRKASPAIKQSISIYGGIGMAGFTAINVSHKRRKNIKKK